MDTYADSLKIDEVSDINKMRCDEWHKDAQPWTSADWGNALAGETGELCNVIKKIRRIETGVPGSKDPGEFELRLMLKQEIADVYLYLDLLATHHNISLSEAVREKFNSVSEREGFYHRL